MATSFPRTSERYPNYELLSCFVDDDGNEYFIYRDLTNYTFGYVLVDYELDNPFDSDVYAARFQNYMSAVSALFDYRIFNSSGIRGTLHNRIVDIHA